MTAMGSVGEIRAPKTRQTMNGMSKPNRRKTPYIIPPTAAVEISTPIVASAPMVHF